MCPRRNRSPSVLRLRSVVPSVLILALTAWLDSRTHTKMTRRLTFVSATMTEMRNFHWRRQKQTLRATAKGRGQSQVRTDERIICAMSTPHPCLQCPRAPVRLPRLRRRQYPQHRRPLRLRTSVTMSFPSLGSDVAWTDKVNSYQAAAQFIRLPLLATAPTGALTQ